MKLSLEEDSYKKGSEVKILDLEASEGVNTYMFLEEVCWRRTLPSLPSSRKDLKLNWVFFVVSCLLLLLLLLLLLFYVVDIVVVIVVEIV